MNILVINSGSSSVKFQLLNMETKEALCQGLIERVGMEKGIFTYKRPGTDKIRLELPIPDHKAGLDLALHKITDPQVGVISSVEEIDACGHRVVHGGDKIKHSVVLCEESMKIIEDLAILAPLHNPANLMGVRALQDLLPARVKHVGVFDTAFHATMAPEAYLYGIPYEMYEKHSIRRFGFHGTSHNYVALRAAEILGRDINDFSCITIHLGNGSSLAAIKNGKSKDTTLGYGTMCGVIMGSRAGDFDPAIILHCIEELGMSPAEVHDMIYKKSGLLGLSGISPDSRDVEDAMMAGNERAIMTVNVLCHSIARQVCALICNLDKLDAIIFTAGIGENSDITRREVCKRLKVLGVEIDQDRNMFRGQERVFSTPESKVKVMVVPTNEELMIAYDTKELAFN